MIRKVVSLDIGTCNTRAVIAEVDDNDKVQVIGFGSEPSQGIRNGVIVNIDAAMNTIKKVLEKTAVQAGVDIIYVYTDIGGSQIESFDSKGQIGIDKSRKNLRKEVDADAKARALDSAKAISIPLDKRLLHIIPQTYIIDGIENQNPLGMIGVRLEVKTHLVTASVTAVKNIEDAVTRAGYELGCITLKTLAASYVAVHDDERDLGSVLIDIGGGTTDVMVINKGSPVYTASIPSGGNRVTSDIAQVFGIPVAAAEKLKLDFGTCWLYGGEENQEVIVPGVGGLPPESSNRQFLSDIIAARMEEILTEAKRMVVRNSNLKVLNGSIVLTGGGAMMKGILELTQAVWNTSSVRISYSADYGDGVSDEYRNADYATALGLVIANKRTAEEPKGRSKSQRPKKEGGGLFMGLLKKFK